MKVKIISKSNQAVEIEKYNFIRKGWIVIQEIKKNIWGNWIVKLEKKDCI